MIDKTVKDIARSVAVELKIKWFFIPTKHNNSTQPSAPQYHYMFWSFLDYLQANIFQQKVQSMRTIHYRIPYCLQGVRKNNYKSF
jgi:hypothetical protein